MQVRTKVELEDALYISQGEENDCLIEVESCIDFNLAFHRLMNGFYAFMFYSLSGSDKCYSFQ